jgi:hypothetical protein
MPRQIFDAPMSVVLGTKIPSDKAEQFAEIAASIGISPSELLRRIVLPWLSNHSRGENGKKSGK